MKGAKKCRVWSNRLGEISKGEVERGLEFKDRPSYDIENQVCCWRGDRSWSEIKDQYIENQGLSINLTLELMMLALAGCSVLVDVVQCVLDDELGRVVELKIFN